MRRLDYQGQEYLIYTRSGMTLQEAMREMGIPVVCECDGSDTCAATCKVRWRKDALFLLTAPTLLEQQVLGKDLESGWRLASQALFK